MKPFEDRHLLDKLKNLIMQLVEVEADVAKLDMSNRMMSVRRVKRAMLLHLTASKQFKIEIDNIRKEIVTEKLNN